MRHDHEFEEPDHEIVEDGAWIVTVPCNFVEITGSQTSERLDETFYETGWECEVYKHVRLDASSVQERKMGLTGDESVAKGDSVLLGDVDTGEMPDELAAQIEQTIINGLGRDIEPFDVYGTQSSEDVEIVSVDRDERVVDVTVSDLHEDYTHLEGTYRVYYDNKEETVHEY